MASTSEREQRGAHQTKKAAASGWIGVFGAAYATRARR